MCTAKCSNNTALSWLPVRPKLPEWHTQPVSQAQLVVLAVAVRMNSR